MNNKLNINGIKRRNFFVYLGVSVAGIFAVSKLPFKFFSNKLNGESPEEAGRINIISNPSAVKRGSKGAFNG